jgi:4-hydroxybenzoate polyprenyltransferase
MVILPIVDLYATACDWRVAGLTFPPAGLYWFIIVSYLNGLVIEIGRKTRAPADEETGVDTYSALWGTTGAARAWMLAVLLTAVAAWRAAGRIGTAGPTVVLLAVLVALCAAAAWHVARHATPGSGKTIETVSGIWTVVMYLGLGAAPLVFAAWR